MYTCIYIHIHIIGRIVLFRLGGVFFWIPDGRDEAAGAATGLCIYIYMYMCIHVCIYVCIYKYIHR